MKQLLTDEQIHAKFPNSNNANWENRFGAIWARDIYEKELQKKDEEIERRDNIISEQLKLIEEKNEKLDNWRDEKADERIKELEGLLEYLLQENMVSVVGEEKIEQALKKWK